MEIVVVWSDSAIDELRDIYDYFRSKAGNRIADKMVNAIVDQTLILEQSPRIGQIEELLTYLNMEIRYLISSNYKIVYMIDENLITIATVFDCRQNPKKLKNKNIDRK